MSDWKALHEFREAQRMHLEEIGAEDNAMKQLLTMAYFVGGAYDGKYMTEAQVEKDLCNGKHSADLSEARARGGCVHHAVLDNCPMVDGYLSPMWDGGMLRYETPDIYEMLSR